MLKFSKKPVFFKEQNFLKENQESFGIFKFSTWNHQNQIIIQSTCVKAALVLCIIVYGKCKHEVWQVLPPPFCSCSGCMKYVNWCCSKVRSLPNYLCHYHMKIWISYWDFQPCPCESTLDVLNLIGAQSFPIEPSDCIQPWHEVCTCCMLHNPIKLGSSKWCKGMGCNAWSE
jgi:hypothetical protein